VTDVTAWLINPNPSCSKNRKRKEKKTKNKIQEKEKIKTESTVNDLDSEHVLIRKSSSIETDKTCSCTDKINMAYILYRVCRSTF